MKRFTTLAFTAFLAPAAYAIAPYSSATLGIINSSSPTYDKATSITNPSPALAVGGGIGQGQVGGNGSTLASGSSRYFCQAAAFRVSDLLASIGSGNLADLANYTFTYAGVTEASSVDIADSSIYFAAYAGQWEDTGAVYTDVPLKGTVANANSQNMGNTPSATNAQRTLFCNAGDAVSGFGGGAPVQTINLGVPDLANTAQSFNAHGFDLSGLATTLAADTDLSNNYVFFAFYLNPKVAVGTAVFQSFSSVSLVPVANVDPKTIASGAFEVAGADYLGDLGFKNLEQSGGTIRFEVGAGNHDQLFILGNYTHTGGDMLVGLLAPPPIGTPVTLVKYDGALSGSPAITLEAGTRFTLASTSIGDGSGDAITAVFGGAAKDLYWTGTAGDTWDLNNTLNWEELPTTQQTFFTFDSVHFDDAASTYTPSISGTLSPAAVEFSNSAMPYTLSGPGAIAGIASLTHSGGNTVTILADNTYSGGTYVTDSNGILKVGDGGTTGSIGSGPVSLAGGLVYQRSDDVVLANAVTGTNGLFTKDGTGMLTITANHAGILDYMVSNGTLRIGAGGTTGALAPGSPVDISAGATIEFLRNGAALPLDAKFSGTGTVKFSGTGNVFESAYDLTGNSSAFAGDVTIRNSRLLVDDYTKDIGAASLVHVLSGGGLYLTAAGTSGYPLAIEGQGWAETAGALGALRLENSVEQAGPVTLTGDARIGISGVTGALSGDIGETGGNHALELRNDDATLNATLTLSGDSNYSGGTTIRGVKTIIQSATALGSGPVTVSAHPSNPARTSSLQIDSVAISNAITVGTAASLTGNGGTSGSVSLTGGTIAPGISIGSLTLGSLDIGEASTYAAEIHSELSDADLITAGGAVTIDPTATLAVADLGGAVLAIGAKLTLIDYTGGSLSGTFSGLAEGASLVVGANTFVIAYHDSDKLTLTVSAGMSAFDSWALGAGLDGSAHKEAGFNDDPESDGLANGLEWVLGGNPLVSDAGSLVTITASATGGLTLVFSRAAGSIGEASLFFDWDVDLDAFANTLATGTSDVGPNGNDPTIDIDAPGVGQITVNIPAANAPDGKLFARLRATMP